ncbi:HNH endonuclease [Streptomyces chartreusis]|uniref:HNH endonuclease n=1 Tax=Streptomyces chartreusis TaxID=1969 RepID=UPI0033D9A58D
MAWQGSTRRSRLPKNWPLLRRKVLRRDNHVCQNRFSEGQLCGREATEVDHIEPGDNHSMANLRALCTWCHARKSGSEGGRAAARMRVRTERPKQTHPALED